MNIFRLNTDALWDGIRDWSIKAGRSAARPVLLMWYVMSSDKTPRKDKLAMFGSLAYLILPIDLLDAHRLPVVGWLDEAVSLAVLIRKCQSISLLRHKPRPKHSLTSGFRNTQNMR